MKRKRLALIVVSAIIIVLIVVAMSVVRDFRNADRDFRIRTAFQQLIGKEYRVNDSAQGVIEIPIEASMWGEGKIAEEFARTLNELDPGEYYFVVFEMGGEEKFIVFNSEPEQISSGLVPFDFILD